MRILQMSVSTVLLAGGLVASTGLAAQAATPSVTIHKIAGKTVANGHKATIKPSVTAHGQVKISSKTLKVTKGKKTVANGKKSVALKAGTYKVTTKVKYRTWKRVAEHDVVAAKGDVVDASCTITSATDLGGTPDVARAEASCTTPESITTFSRTARVTQADVASWTVPLASGATTTVGADSVGGLVGTSYSGAVATDRILYAESTHLVTKYSSYITKTHKQSLKIKTKKPKHACTKTSKGTCIKGGEFCKKAAYGNSGWDAQGRRYVCKGSSSHPHWELP